jgi:hypothetical protein
MKSRLKWVNNGIRLLALSVCVLTVLVGITRGQPRPIIIRQPPIPRPPVIPRPITPPPIVNPPVINPPVMPPIHRPPITPPIIINPRPNLFNDNTKEWFCTRCNHVLSRGPVEPVHILNCPSCNARFTNGPVGGNVNVPNNAPPVIQPQGIAVHGNNGAPHRQDPNDASVLFTSTGFLVVAGIIAIVFVIIVGSVIGYFVTRGSDKPTTRKSRRRVRDD